MSLMSLVLDSLYVLPSLCPSCVTAATNPFLSFLGLISLHTLIILEKYSGASMERSHFIAICGCFEFSGVIVNHSLIDQDVYFDIFNPTPFLEYWN
jgi:hypothetical protein